MKPVDVLIHYPLSEVQVKDLSALSPRLRILFYPGGDFSEIPMDEVEKAEILLTGTDVPDPEMAPELKWIQYAYAGVEFIIGHPILKREGFKVTTLSGAAAPKIAEYALMALLAMAHRLPMIVQYQEKKIWPPDKMKRFQPSELRGSTVGMLGYGSTARALAHLLQPFGVKILATKNDLSHLTQDGYILQGFGDPNGEYFTRMYPTQATHSVLRESDFVVVCLPLTSQTVDLINTAEFEVMKPSAFLLAIGRGGQVNEDALLIALREKKIAGAVLDVFNTEPLIPESPLWGAPNLVVTPHIAGDTRHYSDMVLGLFKENLSRYLEEQELLNVFDPKKGY